MKLALFTDSLGSGGAQRQLCLLAREFSQRGHDVVVVTYSSDSFAGGRFFEPNLMSNGIPHHVLATCPRVLRPILLQRFLRAADTHAVLAFQVAPSLYAELARPECRRPWGLVVSERGAVPGSDKGWQAIIRLGHHLADYVVCNSEANRKLIENSRVGLGGSVRTIYNAVDLHLFRPLPGGEQRQASRTVRLVTLASYGANKNLGNVLQAVRLLVDRGEERMRIDWYGNSPEGPNELLEGRRYIRAHGLEKFVDLHEATTDALEAYHAADAALLASYHEGCPNTLCEAMGCGLPVLASRVCDNPLLIQEGKTGLLFDPTNPGSIADAISSFVSMSLEARIAWGKAARQRAERMFDPARCADRYLTLLGSSAQLHRKAEGSRA